MIRVLLVDDHTAFLYPLAFLLDREPDLSVVGQAESLTEARRLLVGIDVAVVDLHLPDGDGIDLIPEFRAANPSGTALVLTGSPDPSDHARAAAAGAAAVLHKSTPLAEVVRVVRRLCPDGGS